MALSCDVEHTVNVKTSKSITAQLSNPKEWLELLGILFDPTQVAPTHLNPTVTCSNEVEWLVPLGRLYDKTMDAVDDPTLLEPLSVIVSTPPITTAVNPEEIRSMETPNNSPLLVQYEDYNLYISDLKQNNTDWIECYVRAVSVNICNSLVRNLGFCNPMTNLTTLIADGNSIMSLAGCAHLPVLHTLSLCNNDITDLDLLLITCNENFPKLSYLSLLGNPCSATEITGSTPSENLSYRIKVSVGIPRLKFLDSVVVDHKAKPRTISAPLKSAVENLRKGDFKRAARNLAKTLQNSTVFGAEITASGLYGILTTAKSTLKAANHAARLQVNEDEQIASLQATFLPQPLSHNGQVYMEKLALMKNDGRISQEEYTHFIRMNASLQQEIADINRSDTILALERFENDVFPEKFQTQKEISVDEDSFSKSMREQGLHHVDSSQVIRRLTYNDLPQELDLSRGFHDFGTTTVTPLTSPLSPLSQLSPLSPLSHLSPLSQLPSSSTRSSQTIPE